MFQNNKSQSGMAILSVIGVIIILGGLAIVIAQISSYIKKQEQIVRIKKSINGVELKLRNYLSDKEVYRDCIEGQELRQDSICRISTGQLEDITQIGGEYNSPLLTIPCASGGDPSSCKINVVYVTDDCTAIQNIGLHADLRCDNFDSSFKKKLGYDFDSTYYHFKIFYKQADSGTKSERFRLNYKALRIEVFDFSSAVQGGCPTGTPFLVEFARCTSSDVSSNEPGCNEVGDLKLNDSCSTWSFIDIETNTDISVSSSVFWDGGGHRYECPSGYAFVRADLPNLRLYCKPFKNQRTQCTNSDANGDLHLIGGFKFDFSSSATEMVTVDQSKCQVRPAF